MDYETMTAEVLDSIWAQAQTGNEMGEVTKGIFAFLDDKEKEDEIHAHSDEIGDSDRVRELKELLEKATLMMRDPNDGEEQMLINDIMNEI